MTSDSTSASHGCLPVGDTVATAAGLLVLTVVIGSGAAGAGAVVARAVPHLAQNRAPAAFSVPQLEQNIEPSMSTPAHRPSRRIMHRRVSGCQSQKLGAWAAESRLSAAQAPRGRRCAAMTDGSGRRRRRRAIARACL